MKKFGLIYVECFECFLLNENMIKVIWGKC